MGTSTREGLEEYTDLYEPSYKQSIQK